MTETYTPKVGDRVRVTHEGEITQINAEGDLYRIGGSNLGRSFTWFDANATDNVTVEKLQDPEPQWVNGDVVRSTILDRRSPYATFVRTEGQGWRGIHGSAIPDGKMSAHWRDGNLAILYKADATDA